MTETSFPLNLVVNSGKSVRTSAISFPLSPHPKAPGIAQVPPKTDGKSESKTLYPVNKGTLPANFSALGLAYLTGH